MLRYRQLLYMRNQASSGLWLAPFLRVATVNLNARNTDGTAVGGAPSDTLGSSRPLPA